MEILPATNCQSRGSNIARKDDAGIGTLRRKNTHVGKSLAVEGRESGIGLRSADVCRLSCEVKCRDCGRHLTADETA